MQRLTTVQVEEVDAREVWNLPIFESYLIIDARPASCFESGHIETAYSFPPIQTENSDELYEKQFFQLFLDVIKAGAPERWSPIVMYSEGGSFQPSKRKKVDEKTGNSEIDDDPEQQSLSWLVNRFKIFKQSPPKGGDYTMERICNQTSRVFIIKQGFRGFRDAYPILCQHTPYDRPTPYHITEGLFLGSRAMASREFDPALLSSLKITAILTHKSSKPLVKGITYITADIPDSDDAPMEGVWDTALSMLKECQDRNEALMVFLHGRSRSASVAVAWAAVHMKLSIDQAYEWVVRVIPSLDRALIFLPQLKEWHSTRGLRSLAPNATS